MIRQFLFYSLIAILIGLILFAFLCPVWYQDNEGVFTLIAISITAIVAIITLNYSVRENNRRWVKEINEATMKHCRHYMQDIITDLLVITESNVLDGPINFNHMTEIKKDCLEKHYPPQFKLYSEMPKELRIKIIRLLHNYNLFAAGFLDGNLDEELGKKLIGYLYCVHVDWLTGLIAFYSSGDQVADLYVKIIELRKQWGIEQKMFEENTK